MGRPHELLHQLGRTLYLRPEWATRTELARRLETSPSSLDPWLGWLAFHRAIRFEAGRLIVERPRLMTLLTSARITHLRPTDPFTTTLTAQQAHRRLEGQRIPHVLAFFTAANQWAFFEERRDLHLYVERGRLRAVQAALEQEASLRRRPSTVQLYLEPLGNVLTLQRGGLPITDIFQTVLDLRAHPEGGAHADFLEKNTLSRLREAPHAT